MHLKNTLGGIIQKRDFISAVLEMIFQNDITGIKEMVTCRIKNFVFLQAAPFSHL